MVLYIVYVQLELLVRTLNSLEQVKSRIEPGEGLLCLTFIVEKRSKLKNALNLLGIVVQTFFILLDCQIVALDLDIKPCQ